MVWRYLLKAQAVSLILVDFSILSSLQFETAFFWKFVVTNGNIFIFTYCKKRKVEDCTSKHTYIFVGQGRWGRNKNTDCTTIISSGRSMSRGKMSLTHCIADKKDEDMNQESGSYKKQYCVILYVYCTRHRNLNYTVITVVILKTSQ